MHNYCRMCGSSPLSPGSGIISDPGAHWWQFWKTKPCPACGGDGYAKPPGWPDQKEIDRLRPKGPFAPPPKRI